MTSNPFNASNSDHLMTPQEAAKFLGTSLSSLARNRIAPPDGLPVLPFLRMGRRTIRYRHTDVLAYLKACTTT